MVASIHDDDPSAVARTFVFGYGSLVARVPPAPGGLTVLAGVWRMWGVAMDNAVEVPGYKRYRHPGTGAAPACLVTFLDLVAADAEAPGVNGVLLEVDDARLAALDDRERNYDRVEVTGRLRPAPRGGSSCSSGRPRGAPVRRRAAPRGRASCSPATWPWSSGPSPRTGPTSSCATGRAPTRRGCRCASWNASRSDR